MKSRLPRILLWLFVIDLGIAFGAGVYEARVVIPQWASLPPSTWPNTGLQFWAYVTTVPLTLLTLANAIAAWRDHSPARSWWLAGVAIVLVERVATFGYFIPAMIGLMSNEGMAPAEVAATLAQWSFLNNARHLLTLAAWIAALKAFSVQISGVRC